MGNRRGSQVRGIADAIRPDLHSTQRAGQFICPVSPNARQPPHRAPVSCRTRRDKLGGAHGKPAGPRYLSMRMASGQRYTWPDEHFTAPMIEKTINKIPTTGAIMTPMTTKISTMLTAKYIKNDI
jgi:hypothetical protein